MGQSQAQLDLEDVSCGPQNLSKNTDLIRNCLSISSALKRGPDSCRAYSQSCASDTERVHNVQLVDVESLEELYSLSFR